MLVFDSLHDDVEDNISLALTCRQLAMVASTHKLLSRSSSASVVDNYVHSRKRLRNLQRTWASAWYCNICEHENRTEGREEDARLWYGTLAERIAWLWNKAQSCRLTEPGMSIDWLQRWGRTSKHGGGCAGCGQPALWKTSFLVKLWVRETRMAL